MSLLLGTNLCWQIFLIFLYRYLLVMRYAKFFILQILSAYGCHIIITNMFNAWCGNISVYQCTQETTIITIWSQEFVGRLPQFRILIYSAFSASGSLFAFKIHSINYHHPFQRLICQRLVHQSLILHQKLIIHQRLIIQ